MPKPNEEDLSRLEKLLAELAPRPSSLDRDRLLYRAGQASMRRRWVWPLATLAASASAVCLATALVLRPVPEPVVRIVRVEVTAPASTRDREPGATPAVSAPSYLPEPLSPTLSYWHLQQQALRFGVESLPDSPARGGENHVATVLTAGSRSSFVNYSLLFPLGEP